MRRIASTAATLALLLALAAPVFAAELAGLEKCLAWGGTQQAVKACVAKTGATVIVKNSDFAAVENFRIGEYVGSAMLHWQNDALDACAVVVMAQLSKETWMGTSNILMKRHGKPEQADVGKNGAIFRLKGTDLRLYAGQPGPDMPTAVILLYTPAAK